LWWPMCWQEAMPLPQHPSQDNHYYFTLNHLHYNGQLLSSMCINIRISTVSSLLHTAPASASSSVIFPLCCYVIPPLNCQYTVNLPSTIHRVVTFSLSSCHDCSHSASLLHHSFIALVNSQLLAAIINLPSTIHCAVMFSLTSCHDCPCSASSLHHSFIALVNRSLLHCHHQPSFNHSPRRAFQIAVIAIVWSFFHCPHNHDLYRINIFACSDIYLPDHTFIFLHLYCSFCQAL
jgi:hypothetical protein